MIESDLAGLAERSQHTEKLSLRLKPRNKHDTAQQHTLYVKGNSKQNVSIVDCNLKIYNNYYSTDETF